MIRTVGPARWKKKMEGGPSSSLVLNTQRRIATLTRKARAATTGVSAGRGLTRASINCMQKLLRICRNGRAERGRRQRGKGKHIANGKGSSDCASARKEEHRRTGGCGREREGDARGRLKP